MKIRTAIRRAERLLPGVAAATGRDPRWQAIIAIGDFIETDPEPVWQFIARWGASDDEDLRDAVACCLLEHVLEYHFDDYFPRVEILANQHALFGDMFRRCWKLGQSELSVNSERFDRLRTALGYVPPKRPTTPEEIAEHERQLANCQEGLETVLKLQAVIHRLVDLMAAHPEHFDRPDETSDDESQAEANE